MGRSRTYADAVTALNSLQSNSAIIEAIRKSGSLQNQYAIPQMVEWARRVGYEPDDFNRLNLIHIAGTKGKGSTSSFISSILSQSLAASPAKSDQSRSVGLYTSPHLRFVRERIQIDNRPLSEEKFARYFFEIWDLLEASAKSDGRDPATKPVYFRFLTLVAFHAYMSEGVTMAVMECGIGGEYDSTNIITQPIVTGITNLAIDHTGLLGESIEEIAWHKAGIMKAGAKCFTIPQKPAATTMLEKRAREKGVDLETVLVHPELQSDSVPLGLSASFQKVNASLAIAIADHVLTKYGFLISSTICLNEEFKRGLKEVRLGGRCETRDEPGITWHIDGGHTLESIELVAQWFAERLRHNKSSSNSSNNDDDEVQSPAGSRQRQRIPRILIFNQQTRDANALAIALHSTLAKALDPGSAPIFTHAIFCPNTVFSSVTAANPDSNASSGSRKAPDLISTNTNVDEVRELSVQKALARKWTELDPETNVKVFESVEEAVEFVRTTAAAVAEEDWGQQRVGGVGVGRHEDQLEIMTLVTGSLHLVGSLLEVLETKNSDGGI